MKIRPDIDVDATALAAFCRRHNVRRLALFGSALRDDFGPQSDIDLLVEFDPGATPGLFTIAGMEEELSGLFGGREIDLRTYHDLSSYFRDEVRDSALPLYAAA